MTTQTSEQLIAEFGWTKKVIKDAIGVTPLYLYVSLLNSVDCTNLTLLSAARRMVISMTVFAPSPAP